MTTCLAGNINSINNNSSSNSNNSSKVPRDSSGGSPGKPTPARNLTHAFEALCIEEEEEDEVEVLVVEELEEDDEEETQDGSLLEMEHNSISIVVVSPTTTSPADSTDQQQGSNKQQALISPTGVADFNASGNGGSSSASVDRDALQKAVKGLIVQQQQQQQQQLQQQGQQQPFIDLHPDLKRDLSQALVNRVSFYAIIHDINKEASAMASNDSSFVLQQQCCSSSCSQQQQPTELEERSPLVIAAIGGSSSDNAGGTLDAAASTISATTTALLDEEEWLLSTIATRDDQEQRRACPDTFLQAMGEKEYENTFASSSSSSSLAAAGNMRTQLWKPSRSWWEAKSGKNPWIEPASHNKRWRYLWPLIHYHKFLAKCIKKLKRNGVDVKQSVSPVAVFLREEVCAVSDHLAALSLFDSDEWMACLVHFHGWTNPESEGAYREAVATLTLRPLAEPGDVDSPLLRSQIDEHFLRTMATARAQLRETAPTERKKKTDGQPPVYPRGSPAVPKHIHPTNSSSTTDQRRQRWPYPPQQQPPQQQPQGQVWWNPHWDPSQQQQQTPQPIAGPYCDNSSVHSGLSADSYPHPPHAYPVQMHPHHHHASPYYPYPPTASSDNSHASGGGYNYSDSGMPYDPNAVPPPGFGVPGSNGWVDPAMMYAMQMQQQSGYYHYQMPINASTGMPLNMSAEANTTTDMQSYASSSETPQKKQVDSSASQSPSWSHLDRATLAMGLATPAKSTSPLTPRRQGDESEQVATTTIVEEPEQVVLPEDNNVENEDAGFAVNAQPLLLQHGQYYGYYNGGVQYGAATGEGGYGPPSPATQFMMSPQASFNYSYGYGFSPGRQNNNARTSSSSATPHRSNRKPPPNHNGEKSPNNNGAHTQQQAVTTHNNRTPPAVRKLSPTASSVSERGSPATVETATESESLHETA